MNPAKPRVSRGVEDHKQSHQILLSGKSGGHSLDAILRSGLLLAVLVLAVSTVWLGAIDKPGAAGISASLCIGLCIFLFLPQFKRFKGLGFEGELRGRKNEYKDDVGSNKLANFWKPNGQIVNKTNEAKLHAAMKKRGLLTGRGRLASFVSGDAFAAVRVEIAEELGL